VDLLTLKRKKMSLVKILLLDDDDSNIKLITKYFKPFGAEVVFTLNADDAIENFGISRPSLSLVSLNLVRSNKWNFLKKTKKSLMPIIGLVERDQSLLMKEGQANGIHAYLVKPLDSLQLKTYLPSLLARVWAIKKKASLANERRHNGDRRIVGVGRRWYDRLNQIDNVEDEEEKGLMNVGRFSICNKKKCIIRNGENVKLTPTEYKLFLLLFRNRDQVVSIDAIISHIWNLNGRASEEDVKQYIYMLRKKIEENPSKPCLILNHKGFGYMLSAR
jgi:two-component system, OmpR family, KDP operon response regulator KdpE